MEMVGKQELWEVRLFPGPCSTRWGLGRGWGRGVPLWAEGRSLLSQKCPCRLGPGTGEQVRWGEGARAPALTKTEAPATLMGRKLETYDLGSSRINNLTGETKNNNS